VRAPDVPVIHRPRAGRPPGDRTDRGATPDGPPDDAQATATLAAVRGPGRGALREPSGHDQSVAWLADYVYGTIATLVAIAGLTFETNPGALTTAGVVVVGAVAIWLAHALSQLITRRS